MFLLLTVSTTSAIIVISDPKGGKTVQIAAFQKLTLLDFPGTVACILFTNGCNFRCPFCHNKGLVLPGEETAQVDENEILDYLAKRKGILEGVNITGGEPMLHADLPELLQKIKALGYKIKVDTNGTRPDMLRHLVENDLVDYIAMDIKNAPEAYPETIGLPKADLDAICASKTYLMEARIPYEFRTTVVKGLHDTEKLIQIAKWIAGAEAYFLQSYTDSGHVLSPEGLSAFSEEEMRIFAEAIRPYVPSAQVRGI